MIGMLLGNRYEILEQLGGGGMAIVYKGRDTILNRLVTIKLMRPEYTSDEDFVRRFSREAQSVAKLSHPNIVSIYDVGRENEIHYLVMEYVDGEDLRSIIKREGFLEPAKAVRIASQVCDALEHAHESNIVHRDVKPHNILITRYGRAKLTDFGIAREASTATVTTTDTILGSVHYISPEQARGEVSDQKSDIYSLGVVLYEMLTGTVPFSGDSPIAIALKHIQSEPEPLIDRKPGIPVALERSVMRALHKDPLKRFMSASEMSSHLDEAMMGDDSDVTRIITVDREDMLAIRSSRHNPMDSEKKVRRISFAGWTLLFILAALLTGSAIYGYYQFVNVPEVKVPSVVNKPLKEAEDILVAKGLKIKVIEQFNNDILEGYVSAQDTGPNDPPVKKNRVITLTVSKGADFRTVPNLINIPIVDARVKLAGEGFLIEELPEEFNRDFGKGVIFSQQPDAGTRALRGSKITVSISKGTDPVGSRVPDLKGLTIDQVRIKLREQKLELDPNIIYQYSTEFMRGQIVQQEPVAGEQVMEGTLVRINVSNGPGPSARDATVYVGEIPDDGKPHVVKINVTDMRGSNDVYIKTHKPGDQIKETVRYWGRATIRVYIDEKLVREQILD